MYPPCLNTVSVFVCLLARVGHRYWTQELEKVDPVTRFFRILKKPNANFLTRADFVPLMQGAPQPRFLHNECAAANVRLFDVVCKRVSACFNC